MAKPAAAQPAGAWRRYAELLLAELDQPEDRRSIRRQRKTTVQQIATVLARWPTVADLAMVPGAESLSALLARAVAADLRRLKGVRTRPSA